VPRHRLRRNRGLLGAGPGRDRDGLTPRVHFGSIDDVPTIASQLLATSTGRPYVLALFAAFLLGAVTKTGWVRALVFAAIAGGAGFAAELASLRWGFPFGEHHFLEAAHGSELWVAGVPAWSPLASCALAWLGFQLAVLLHSPVEATAHDLQVLDTLPIRRSARVLLTGSILAMLPQVLLAPLSALGDRWFLGRLHDFGTPGIFFGVPATAIVGWAAVAALAIFLFQRIDSRLVTPSPLLRAGQAHLPFGGLFEPLVYAAVATLGIALAASIGEPLLAMVGSFVFVPLAVVYAAHLVGAPSRATAAEREAHRRDFPRSRALA